MPIYTYECPEGHRWDETRSITDPMAGFSSQPCPEGCECPDPDCSAKSFGAKVWNPGDMRPVYKGRGWARKDHKDASKP